MRYTGTPTEKAAYNAVIAACLAEMKNPSSMHHAYQVGRGLERLLVHPERLALTVETAEPKARILYACPVLVPGREPSLFFRDWKLRICGLTKEVRAPQVYFIEIPQLKSIVAAHIPSDYRKLLTEMAQIRAGEYKPARQIKIESDERVLAKSR